MSSRYFHRALACEFNLIELRKRAQQLYMWTLTFPFYARPEYVRDAVRRQVQWFTRHGASGVRVYEVHKTGSLHIHCVVDHFFYCCHVDNFWRSMGGGRVHRKFLPRDDPGLYIAKELGKQMSDVSFAPHTRRYSAFGELWGQIGKTCVVDVRFSSGDFVSYVYGRDFRSGQRVKFNMDYFGLGFRDHIQSDIRSDFTERELSYESS